MSTQQFSKCLILFLAFALPPVFFTWQELIVLSIGVFPKPPMQPSPNSSSGEELAATEGVSLHCPTASAPLESRHSVSPKATSRTAGKWVIAEEELQDSHVDTGNPCVPKCSHESLEEIPDLPIPDSPPSTRTAQALAGVDESLPDSQAAFSTTTLPSEVFEAVPNSALPKSPDAPLEPPTATASPVSSPNFRSLSHRSPPITTPISPNRSLSTTLPTSSTSKRPTSASSLTPRTASNILPYTSQSPIVVKKSNDRDKASASHKRGRSVSHRGPVLSSKKNTRLRGSSGVSCLGDP